jgi:hypothetical protein
MVLFFNDSDEYITNCLIKTEIKNMNNLLLFRLNARLLDFVNFLEKARSVLALKKTAPC